MKLLHVIVIACLVFLICSRRDWSAKAARIRASLSTFGAPRQASGMGREIEAGLNSDPSAAASELAEIERGFSQK